MVSTRHRNCQCHQHVIISVLILCAQQFINTLQHASSGSIFMRILNCEPGMFVVHSTSNVKPLFTNDAGSLEATVTDRDRHKDDKNSRCSRWERNVQPAKRYLFAKLSARIVNGCSSLTNDDAPVGILHRGKQRLSLLHSFSLSWKDYRSATIFSSVLSSTALPSCQASSTRYAGAQLD